MKTSRVFVGVAGVGLLAGLGALGALGGSGAAQGSSDAAARVAVPQGFSVSVFRDGLSGPRMMAFGPDGQLYVSLTRAGNVARMAVSGGRAGGLQNVKTGLRLPHGLEWRREGDADWLYVAEETRVQRFRLGADGALGPGQVLVNDLPGGGNHTSRTVHFGPDGKMYVAVGSATNKGDEPDVRRAVLLRYNPDGSVPADNPFAASSDPKRRPIWAEGLRNTVDFLWTPSGQLWASTHGSDNVILKPGDPPDIQPYEKLVNQVEKGKHYGWPYCIPAKLGVNTAADQQIPDPTTEASNARSFDCAAKAVPPLFTVVAHAAPLGMSWGTNFAAPEAYQNSLYIALHGSWNTNNPQTYRDCKVERVILENGRPVRSEPFLTVRRAANEQCGQAWGRPADVVIGPDGAMYVTDDQGGRILRVTHGG